MMMILLKELISIIMNPDLWYLLKNIIWKEAIAVAMAADIVLIIMMNVADEKKRNLLKKKLRSSKEQ